MSEYRFHLQSQDRLQGLCPKCGMKSCFTRYVDEKAQVSFLIKWADATISTVAATIIPQRNIFRTTRLSKKCWLNKRGMATVYQQPSHQRQSRCLIPFQRFLIFPQIGWSSPCGGLTSTHYTDTLPQWQERKKRIGCSIFIRSVHPRCGNGAIRFLADRHQR